MFEYRMTPDPDYIMLEGWFRNYSTMKVWNTLKRHGYNLEIEDILNFNEELDVELDERRIRAECSKSIHERAKALKW